MAKKSEVMTILFNHEGRIGKVEEFCEQTAKRLDSIDKNSNLTKMIIVYVVVPLIVVLGALVGIKIMLP